MADARHDSDREDSDRESDREDDSEDDSEDEGEGEEQVEVGYSVVYAFHSGGSSNKHKEFDILNDIMKHGTIYDIIEFSDTEEDTILTSGEEEDINDLRYEAYDALERRIHNRIKQEVQNTKTELSKKYNERITATHISSQRGISNGYYIEWDEYNDDDTVKHEAFKINSMKLPPGSLGGDLLREYNEKDSSKLRQEYMEDLQRDEKRKQEGREWDERQMMYNEDPLVFHKKQQKIEKELHEARVKAEAERILRDAEIHKMGMEDVRPQEKGKMFKMLRKRKGKKAVLVPTEKEEREMMGAEDRKVFKPKKEIHRPQKLPESRMTALEGIMKEDKIRKTGVSQCPVCFQSKYKTQYAPFSCGHKVCKDCKTKLSKCPICRVGKGRKKN